MRENILPGDVLQFDFIILSFCRMIFSQDAEDGTILELDEKYFETTKTTATPTTSTTTNSTTNNHHVTSSPCAKRKRVEPSSLSEQEQIELAIGKI